MKVLGLTGGIGMGKSTAAAMLRYLRLPVHDSDAAVHRLMGPGGAAVAQVAAVFPETLRGNFIDRAALGKRVFADPAALKKLEKILHPLVRASQSRFLKRARARRAKTVVLDIPLLYETGGEKHCDAVILVTAPAFLQRARVMARPRMTEATFRAILKKQMPDREKRKRADYIVPTGLGRAVTFRHLKRILSAV